MNRLVGFSRRVCPLVLAGVYWLAWNMAALAQAPGPGQEKAEETPPYVVPYAIVILCVGLGVTIVLNSSKRRDRAKPEVFGEPK